jgi:DNA-binding Lrp family transcriptional regulator
MAVVKKGDDEIRLKMLESLMKKRGICPNMREIQKETGYHKATIKSSIDFLEKEGFLSGYGPKINFRKFGYRLEVIEMLQMDKSKKELFSQYLKKAEKDPNLFRLSAIMKIPNIYDLIKDRQIFYATEPLYKNASRTASVLDIIKTRKGIE